MTNFDNIAAKSRSDDKSKWISFKVHSLDTAGIMRKLYHRWLSENIKFYLIKELHLSNDNEEAENAVGNFCELIALLHDIGKLTPAFQNKISKNIENYDMGLEIEHIPERKESPHALAGQVILETCGFSEEIASIIGSHHGKSEKANCKKQLGVYRTNYFGALGKQEQQWRSIWNEWIAYALDKTDFHSVENLPKPNVKVQMILTGLLIMADWISSNVKYFPYDMEGEKERIKYAWAKLGLLDTWEAKTDNDLQEFFHQRFKFPPNPVQNTVMQTVAENYQAGIYILEAPMGSGKTEAALAAAEILAEKLGCGGLFFGLPTQATANGVFERVHEWTKKLDDEKHSVRLAHGMIELNDEYQSIFHGTANDSGDENVIVHKWFEGRKQALLADFVTGTVDHFLLASLKQKHVMLRHLGLAGKMVIIDECHAYDAYMNIYLDNTLKWMGAYHVPVIILSATLPPQRRNELIKAYLNVRKIPEIRQQCDEMAYPVLTWTNGQNVMQKAIPTQEEEKHISVVKIQESDIITQLSEKLSDGGCGAVIVNTVKQAQKLSQEISEKLSESGFEVICFHSHFISEDRAKIEKTILEKVGKKSEQEQRNHLIVVGTQVLEQSLDIDFDYMITELCPMDLLLQRSGRLHRHERKRPEKLQSAELAVTHPEKNAIYDEWILQQTEKLLPDILTIPSCIPHLVSEVYAEHKEDALYQAYEMEIKKKKRNARKYCIDASLLEDEDENTLACFLNDDVGNDQKAEASVRDADETIEVLVLKKISEYQYSTVSEEFPFDITQTPDENTAKQIARQRLKLPAMFSHHFETLKPYLDTMPKQWRFSEWLNGEWLLLLDENAETELLGLKLQYNSQYGLMVFTNTQD